MAAVHVALYDRTDPRLGRHEIHDERSRSFAMRAVPLPRKPVMHERHLPIWDQGSVGSCTANAGLGMISTGPLRLAGDPVWTEADAVKLYSEETRLDDRVIPGHYPPTDSGSSGLYLCKALKARGLITSYWHAFSVSSVLGMLATQPCAIGIPWYEKMFTPNADGVVRPGGAIAGGHEVCLDGIDPQRRLVRFANSWGPGWGRDGWGFLGWDDLGRLLAEGGDAVTVTRA